MFWQTTAEDHAGRPSWWEDREGFLEELRRYVPFQRFCLAMLYVPDPRPDELLLIREWSGDMLARWFGAALLQDPLFKTARRRGVAVASPGDPDRQPSPLDREHILLAMFPESLADRRWWTLLLGRDDAPFNMTEQQMAGLLLRQWQVDYNHTGIDYVGRILIGYDDRMVHADPRTQLKLMQHPQMFDSLRQTLHTVVEQRWPGLPDREKHDFAIEVNDEPHWICFYRDRVPETAASTHWLVELRRLEPDELPTVGAIEDDRIARAVGYLHDNFHESPSLAQIAEAVHVSPFHFHRLFTKYVGISPKQYLQRKQLQVARWLLRSTRLPVGTIAVRTGFSSHGHFTSTFHRLTGVSPSQYREQH